MKPDLQQMQDKLHEIVRLINASELEAIKEQLNETENAFNSIGLRYCVCLQLTVTVLKQRIITDWERLSGHNHNCDLASFDLLYCSETRLDDCASIFTALHGMQTRSSDKNSVCLSVCLSVRHTRGL